MKEKIISSSYKGERPSEEDAREHIQKKFDNKRTPGENTTSTANFLRQQSAEVFHAGYHFIYELLQNADDAEAKEIIFELTNDHLIIMHNGYHFERDDVERICDTSSASSSKKNTKPHQSEKIGYKGIGFKAVFALSNQVTVLSGPYRFKFDEIQCQKLNTKVEGDETEYPWQIMPILIEIEDIKEKFPGINLDFVSFILNNVDVNKVRGDLTEIISNPKILIFLKNVNVISVIEKRPIFKIKKTKVKEYIFENNMQKMEENILEMDRFNGMANSAQTWRWLCYSQTVSVTPDLQKSMQKLSDSSCPPKIKTSKHTEITLAVEIKAGKSPNMFNFERVSESVLYCYLPTKVETIMPYLINANFLLGQDRSDVRDNNPWNKFLLEEIAVVQFEWLRILAQEARFRNNVLCLFNKKDPHVFKLTKNLNRVYMDSYDKVLQTIPFVPSKEAEGLLRVNELVIDETQFFYHYSEHILEPALVNLANGGSLVVSEELLFLDNLGDVKKYTWERLQNNIEQYMEILFHKRAYITLASILQFIISREKLSDFYNKKIIMTVRGVLASPCDCFIPSKVKGNDHFPSEPEYPLNIMDVAKYPELKTPKKELAVKTLSHKNYIEIYLNKLLLNKKITELNWVKYLRYLYQACQQDKHILEKVKKRKLGNSDFSRFPIQTKKGAMRPIYLCFIKSFCEESIASSTLISDNYFKKGDDVNLWETLLITMGIKVKMELELQDGASSYEKLTEYFGEISSDLEDIFYNYIDEMIKSANSPLRSKSIKARQDLIAQSFIENMLFFDILFQENVPLKTRWLLFLQAIQERPEFLKEQSVLYTETPKRKSRTNECRLDAQFLIYFFRNYFKIEVLGGKFKFPKDIYCTPKLLELSAELSFPIPIAKFPIHNSLILSQMKLLGFRTELPAAKALKILHSLNGVGEKQVMGEEFIKKLGSVYQVMIDLSDLPIEEELVEWKEENKLLAYDGKFYTAKNMKVYDLRDDEKYEHPQLWLHVSSLNIEQSRKLANFLRLPCFSEEKKFVFTQETNTELKEGEKLLRQALLAVLAVGVVSEAAELSWGDTEQYISLYGDVLEKFKKIKFSCCKRIEILFDGAIGQSNLRTTTKKVHMDGNNLYFCGRFSRTDILRKIAAEIANVLFKTAYAKDNFQRNVLFRENFDDLWIEVCEGQSQEFKTKIEKIELAYRGSIQEIIRENVAPNTDEDVKNITPPQDIDNALRKTKQTVIQPHTSASEQVSQSKGKNGMTQVDASKGDIPTRKEEKIERSAKGKEEVKPSHSSDTNVNSFKRDPKKLESSFKRAYAEGLKIQLYSLPKISRVFEKKKELRRNSSSHPKRPALSDKDKAEVGFIGEQLVFFALRAKYIKNSYEISDDGVSFEATKKEKGTKKIIWHNGHEESYKPYDITIERAKGQKTIEVKTSSKIGPSKVYYSASELRKAFEHGNRYTLFKVSGVDLEKFKHNEVDLTQIKIEKIKNPAETIFKDVNVGGIQAEPTVGSAPIMQIVFKI